MTSHRNPAEYGPQVGAPIVELRNLTVSFAVSRSTVYAVNGVDLELGDGESLGILGESGCGKSVTCRALLGLLPEHARVEADTLRIGGVDVSRDSAAHARARGTTLAMVGQDPVGALNPHVPVGTQIERVLKARGVSGSEIRGRAGALLDEVGIAASRFAAYPGELSGGMCQRVAIALAVATGARALIADEPTSNLDVTTQMRILELLQRLRTEDGLSLILVTHDVDLALRMCDRVLVMYGGLVVEDGPSEAIPRAAHPYTRGLLAAVPRLSAVSRTVTGIRGAARVIERPVVSCPFADRCDHADDLCRAMVPPVVAARQTRVRCFHPRPGLPRVADPAGAHHDAARTHRDAAGAHHDAANRRATGTHVLRVDGLSVTYRVRRGLFLGREVGTVDALQNLRFDVQAGEILGVIGETGAGKSTLLRALLRLEPEATGTLELDGTDVSRLTETEFRPFRERVQIVFQNPSRSLDPTYAAWRAVAEPLAHLRAGNRMGRWAAAVQALAACGLDVGHASRPAVAFSGGQKQRIAISRAVVDPPRLLLADEPVSSLDASVQADVINLLRRLVGELGFGMLFVSHDIAVVKMIADSILILRQGRIVEHRAAPDFFARPETAYARQLLNAASWTSARGSIDG